MTVTKLQTGDLPQLNVWERVEIIVGDGREAGKYVARVEDFCRNGVIINAPDRISGDRQLTDGAPVSVLVTRQDAVYQFRTTIQPLIGSRQRRFILQLPDSAERLQRRRYVRVDMHDEVRFARIPTGDQSIVLLDDPAWDTAAASHESSNGSIPDYSPIRIIGTSELQDGTNTLAVGVWNDEFTSSDLVLVPLLAVGGAGCDNCPFEPNAGQADTGGIGVGSPPDGIGDACQCGDVNGDGFVTSADSAIILRSQLVPPTATNPKRRLACSGLKRSAIRDQKIDTTKRLNTDVQTKKTLPAQIADVAERPRKKTQNAIRLAAKKV